ncbi:MAG: hypothetical protein ACFE8P_13030, partial [Promethearchaeota archaeon]
MDEFKKFFAYELEENGDRQELIFFEKDLKQYLDPEKVLVLVREDLRRIFIWNGAKSPVKKRFITARFVSDLQKELMKDSRYHRCKIVSVDQGDEIQEFLDAFNLESMEVKEKLADLQFIPNNQKKEYLKKSYPEEKEFRINEYLTLKLIKGKTVIFIDEKPFHQCKYLLLNLTQKDFTEFDNIDSIDDAFEIYNK